MRKLLLTAMLAGASALALPATAQPSYDTSHYPSWRYDGGTRNFELRIDRLENRIERAAARRLLTYRESNWFRRQTAQLDRLLDRYERGGLNRWERSDLNWRIGQIEARFEELVQRRRYERRWDRDDRYDRPWYDYDDRYRDDDDDHDDDDDDYYDDYDDDDDDER